MKKRLIKSLYYITHIENLPSILEQGILSHQQVEEQKLSFTPIYDSDIVNMRQGKATPNHDSLWEYTNLYFQPRNPMMYRVVHEKNKRDIAILGVKPSILNKKDVLITDGNAANASTQFFSYSEGLEVIKAQWKVIQNDWWKSHDGSKRKIMAECLIRERVKPELIHSIFVTDDTTRERVESIIGPVRIPVIPESHMFFQPRSSTRIGTNISLIEGDMFFSNMQTLTISVNLQGIMGRGLASRAKYQFPDVYVVYQDACRNKQITATTPYVYKREASFDEELADLSRPLSTPNSIKWFLLFATKRKWRDNSRLDDIERGLDWLRTNFEQEGIQSLAMPALGCGLGNLDWSTVGPVMCRSLHEIGISVAIYLPRERKIEPQFLEASYLLKY